MSQALGSGSLPYPHIRLTCFSTRFFGMLYMWETFNPYIDTPDAMSCRPVEIVVKCGVHVAAGRRSRRASLRLRKVVLCLGDL